MKLSPALTIIEVLIVVALIGVIALPLYVSYTKTQANQSLRSSTEQLADTIKRAHLFSREAKDEKSWGVKRNDEKSYMLLIGPQSTPKTDKTTYVEALVTLPEQFEVWFNIGTGETPENKTITLENKYGLKSKINVYKTGIIDVVLNP